MTSRDILTQSKSIIGPFPDTYCYSKRMIEHLIIQQNKTNIPLVILRPSIIGTAANEPLPGWTDSTGLIQGASLLIGLGVLRDMPGNADFIADIVPVDFVSRHILLSIPYII